MIRSWNTRQAAPGGKEKAVWSPKSESQRLGLSTLYSVAEMEQLFGFSKIFVQQGEKDYGEFFVQLKGQFRFIYRSMLLKISTDDISLT